jgi:hypothetical protein
MFQPWLRPLGSWSTKGTLETQAQAAGLEHAKTHKALPALPVPNTGGARVEEPSPSTVGSVAGPPPVQACGVGTTCATLVACLVPFVGIVLILTVKYYLAVRKERHDKLLQMSSGTSSS